MASWSTGRHSALGSEGPQSESWFDNVDRDPDLMKDQKYYKGKPTYREIDEVIKRKCKDAQEAWYNDKCADIKSLAKNNNHCHVYEEIKHFMTEKNVSSGSCIQNESGDVLFDTNKILNRWTEYVEKLFDDKRDKTYLHHFLQGLIILKSEVENVHLDLAGTRFNLKILSTLRQS